MSPFCLVPGIETPAVIPQSALMTIRANLAALVAAAGGFCPAFAGPAITIRVVNEAADPESLSRARLEVSEIFARSGIDLIWRDCVLARTDGPVRDACQGDRGPAEFWMRIVIRRPPHASKNVLGFAELDTRSAGIYYPAAAGIAQRSGTGAGRILGAAMAHEIGHLLLGARAHARHGVMRANWDLGQIDRISRGALDFTPDEARLLRERLWKLTPAAGAALGIIDGRPLGGISHAPVVLVGIAGSAGIWSAGSGSGSFSQTA